MNYLKQFAIIDLNSLMGELIVNFLPFAFPGTSKAIELGEI